MCNAYNFYAVTFLLFCFMAAPNAGYSLSFSHRPSFPDIVGEASLSFHGIVRKVEYSYVVDPETKKPIPYTIVFFEVKNGVKNAKSGQTITIRQGGGWYPGGRYYGDFAGTPTFQEGEEVIIFTNDQSQPFFGALFGNLGVFRIICDFDNKQYILTEMGYPLIWKTPESAFRVSYDVACIPDETDRVRCKDWLLGPGSEGQEEFDEPVGGMTNSLGAMRSDGTLSDGISMVELDEFLDYIDEVSNVPLDPVYIEKAQVITNDRVKFEEAYLRMFTSAEHLQAVQSKDNGEKND